MKHNFKAAAGPQRCRLRFDRFCSDLPGGSFPVANSLLWPVSYLSRSAGTYGRVTLAFAPASSTPARRGAVGARGDRGLRGLCRMILVWHGGCLRDHVRVCRPGGSGLVGRAVRPGRIDG
uniref:Uncharacterized protein n=1 Tax=Streptomyces spectabilis TaxID=68270 RepID=A0A286SC12_STRST|nr:hypothetical protein [Streptomyces spectabilis]